MKIIAVANQKGGCGKTITAVNLAAALSRKGHSVLLVDLDPQAHATFALGRAGERTIADFLENPSVGSEKQPQERFVSISETFSFIPSSLGLAAVEHRFASRDDKLQMLSTFMKTIWGFDYVLIDCPPNLGVLTLNALGTSHYTLIPLSVCDFSLKGTEMLKSILVMLKEFKGRTPAPFHVLTQVDSRSRYSKEFLVRAKQQLGNLLLNTRIRTNIYLREAASQGKTIFEYRADSNGAADYTALAQEIGKLTSKDQWTSLFLKGKDLSSVYVVGDFNEWKKKDTYKLKKAGEDIWSINIPLKKGTYRYKFVADESWISDPHNKFAEADNYGGRNSLLYIE